VISTNQGLTVPKIWGITAIWAVINYSYFGSDKTAWLLLTAMQETHILESVS